MEIEKSFYPNNKITLKRMFTSIFLVRPSFMFQIQLNKLFDLFR